MVTSGEQRHMQRKDLCLLVTSCSWYYLTTILDHMPVSLHRCLLHVKSSFHSTLYGGGFPGVFLHCSGLLLGGCAGGRGRGGKGDQRMGVSFGGAGANSEQSCQNRLGQTMREQSVPFYLSSIVRSFCSIRLLLWSSLPLHLPAAVGN